MHIVKSHPNSHIRLMERHSDIYNNVFCTSSYKNGLSAEYVILQVASIAYELLAVEYIETSKYNKEVK